MAKSNMELNRSRNRSCFEYGIRELGHANSRNIFCVASDIFLAWVCRSSAMLYTPRTPAFGVKLSQQLPYRMQSHPADASCISEIDSESILRCTQQKRLPMKKYTVKLLLCSNFQIANEIQACNRHFAGCLPQTGLHFSKFDTSLSYHETPKKTTVCQMTSR